MNLKHIINEIENVDPEVHERLDTRRQALKDFSRMAGKVAIAAAVPFALGSMFKKAYGQSTASLFDVLNYALTLEYLEAEFYKMGNDAAGLIPAGAPAAAIKTIGDHETAHVAFLQAAIAAAGGTPVTKPKFDLTAKGTFPTVFSDYATFLAVAQTFEDTGVRAYKGQAANPNLMANNDVLTAALNIHSVEARHASHIRQMRKANGFGDVKPWITGKESGIGAVVQASYDGEEITNQAGIEIVNINGQSVSSDAASEAFDEPLSMDQVLAIVKPFFA
ncbi:MAG: ferritin-like domain-containing protein [Bacteroidota bacterium]